MNRWQKITWADGIKNQNFDYLKIKGKSEVFSRNVLWKHKEVYFSGQLPLALKRPKRTYIDDCFNFLKRFTINASMK